MFNKIFAELAGKGGKPERIMIDATHLKAHRTAASLFKKWPVPRRIGRTKGGLNSKLHAVCDNRGRPLVMLLSEGQMSDYKGAAALMFARPAQGPKELLADKGYDADWFRAPPWQSAASPSASRRNPIGRSPSSMTPSLYKQRHKNRKHVRTAQRLAAHPHLDTTAAPTPTCRQSVSPQPSPFGSDQ